MQFQQPNRHHCQVRHHVALFQKSPHRPEHFGRVGALPSHHAIEGQLRFVSPVPCILEGLNLRAGPLTGGSAKQYVVRRLAVERRIEVDEVRALIVDSAPQNSEVVAVVELIHESASVANLALKRLEAWVLRGGASARHAQPSRYFPLQHAARLPRNAPMPSWASAASAFIDITSLA